MNNTDLRSEEIHELKRSGLQYHHIIYLKHSSGYPLLLVEVPNPFSDLYDLE